MEEAIRQILIEIGEDPQREGLIKTPRRVSEALRFLTSGYKERLEDIIGGSIFNEENNEMVIVRNLEFYSMCEHHMLPFFGSCHVGYIPDGKVIGVSKITRLVHYFSRRLQVQERLTNEIAQTLDELLKPVGVAVVIEAKHLCMMMRGARVKDADMVTSKMIGGFQKRAETRTEFLRLIRNS